MSLIERYRQGETITVWEEIYALANIDATHPQWFEASAVAEETIKRVRHNMNIILAQLQNSSIYPIEQTTLAPQSETSIKELKAVIKPFGTIPLSLELFYKIIGPVNLIQQTTPLQFEYADPLYIESVENTIILSDEGWQENMEEMIDEEGINAYIEISPDYYHKDDVSGGMSYGIELTAKQTIDAKLVNTKYGDIYFVQYLRLCFENGGFPNIKECNEGYEDFINTIKKEFIAF